MGSLHAQEFAQMDVDIETAIGWHLQSNHFPPIPKTMVQPCIEAIDAYWEQDTDRLISLPEGVGYKGLTVAPAWAIIEQHHLDAWCMEDQESDEDWLMSNS